MTAPHVYNQTLPKQCTTIDVIIERPTLPKAISVLWVADQWLIKPDL